MIRHLTLTLCFMAFLIAPTSLWAQDTAPQNSGGQGSENLQVNPENLNELIKTLESETARTEFLDNLKALVETQEQTGAAESEELVNPIGLDRQINSFVGHYEAFLNKHDLNGSIVGRVIITIIAMIGAALLAFLNRKLFVSMRDRVLAFTDKLKLTHTRFRVYARMFRYCGYAIITLFFFYTLSVIWDINIFGFVRSDLSLMIFSNFVSIVFITIVAIVLWEAINSFIEYYLWTADEKHVSNVNRLRTLLPIIQNVLFIVLAGLFILVMLSELGINIMPLLAGAGILGIAIGFGAQTMVKDFLTGFTIILEDLVQVGDVVKVSDRLGLVEKITMRKIQLRDISGIVYTIPYSEVTIVENLTKDFSYYLMDIGVAYRENTDEVIKLLREVDEDLRADEDYKNMIIAPLEILGVDRFADSAVIIRARIKTKPIQQWNVGREFNRRMKMIFDANNIEIPFPHQTVYFGEDKDGSAPAAPILLKEKKAAEKAAPKKKKKSSGDTDKNVQPKASHVGEAGDKKRAEREARKEEREKNQ